MRKLWWGNVRKDIKTFLNRNQVERLQAVLENIVIDWT
jgi:hypothetical protein